MVIEIAGIITAIEAISKLIDGTAPLVQSISTKWFAKNDETKNQLMKKLEELQTKVAETRKLTSELAEVGVSYFQAYENILQLRLLCSRAEEFLNDNINEFQHRDDVSFAGNWKVLETLFKTISNNMGVPKKVVLNRDEWYDVQDKSQINIKLDDFNTAYNKAVIHLRTKVPNQLLDCLQDMTNKLSDAEILLRTTIYTKILKPLQKAGV